jgi:hypothetical protein
MADEIRAYTCVVPAGTTPAAPAVFPMVFPPREVHTLQVIVPPGPSGLVGWHVLVANALVIPYQSDTWVVTAAENITWPLDHMPNSGSWSVEAYNTGAVDHSITFRWLLGYITPDTPARSAMIDDSLIGPASYVPDA